METNLQDYSTNNSAIINVSFRQAINRAKYNFLNDISYFKWCLHIFKSSLTCQSCNKQYFYNHSFNNLKIKMNNKFLIQNFLTWVVKIKYVVINCILLNIYRPLINFFNFFFKDLLDITLVDNFFKQFLKLGFFFLKHDLKFLCNRQII